MVDFTSLWNALHTLHPLTLAFALIAALGVVLMGTAWGLVRGINLNPGRAISLAAESDRIAGTAPDSDSFVSRVLKPILQAVMTRTGERERLWVERAYDLLDRQHGSSEYYTKKVACAISGFALGIVLGLNFADVGLWPLLILPMLLGLLGYILPRLELQADLKRRSERIFFEVPYALDRLGVNVMSQQGDLVEGLKATLKRPEGGYLMRELLQVVEDNTKAGHIDHALRRMAERNADVPIVVRIAELLAHSQEAGTDLVQALQDIGDRAVDEVESLIRARGEENSQLMVAPSIIALSGIFVALLGPSMLDLMNFVQ
jgi:Flp pilus assembly protein TadB